MVLLPDPELERPALLHVPDLVGPPEGGVQVHAELQPFPVISDHPANIDEENVVLATVLPHVHLPGGLLTLGAGGPGVVLGVGGVAWLLAGAGVGVAGVASPGAGGQTGPGHLDTGSDGRSRLLVSLGTPVTLLPGHSVLAGTLATGLVTDLPAGPHRVTVAGSAGLLVRHRLLGVPVVALLAVVAVSARGVVPALVADPSGHSARQTEELHVEPAPSGVQVAVAGLALVCLVLGGSAPGSVEVEGFALLALPAGGVVLAVAGQVPVLVVLAPAGVTVTLAPSSYRQVRHGQVLARHRVSAQVALLGRLVCVDGVGLDLSFVMLDGEDHHDVCGRDPVLQHGTVLEVLRAGSVCQGGEGDPGAGPVLADVSVQTQSFLLVSAIYRNSVVSVPNISAVTRVILERLPGLAVIHGLVNCQRVRLLVAELERDVSQFELLTKRQGKADVSVFFGEQFTVPASHIVWVV